VYLAEIPYNGTRLRWVIGGSMRNLRSRWVLVALICTLLFSFSLIANGQQAAIASARVTQPVNLANLVTLRGNTHPLARPEYDQGAAPDSLPTERILLVLQRSAQQEAALRKLLDQQQVKSSPNYHMWLTPEQFGEQFGPADADIQAVTNWLTSQGFQVNHVAAGRTVIEFSGTAGQVRQALHTEIHKYVVHGEEHWANSSDPQIPAALAPVVAGFASLHNFPKRPMTHKLGTFTRSKQTGKVQPQFTFPVSCPSGSGNATCYELGVGPGDFATIYNTPDQLLNPHYNGTTVDGTGQTIAIVAETNINPQDMADFRSMFGLPANAPNVILNGPDPGIIPPTVSSDETESDLDVEWSGAVAKGATIDLVVSETTDVTAGVDLSALYIIDNDLAPVMTESYGACEAELGAGSNAFYNAVWEQGAAQGITIVEASGDSGSAACDAYAITGINAAQYGLMVDGFASTPFNVAVGGTDFNDSSSFSTYWSTTDNSTTQASAKSYIPEMTWNDTCASSGVPTDCTASRISSDNSTNPGSDLAGGGGGASNCASSSTIGTTVTCLGGYPKPPWQSGTGVPSDQVRDIPDVSLFAGDGMNASFYVFCEIDANAFLTPPGSSTSCDLNSPYTDFQGAGGTSASAQAFGGIMALVNQKYGRQGNANYVLYPLAAQSGASCPSNAAAVTNAACIFYDIQTGNNSVACVGGSPNCSNTSTATGQYGILVNPSATTQAAWTTTPGYDLATGLGTVNVANLVAKWPSASFTPTTTTLSITPTTLTHGQSATVTVSVSPNTATGDVSLLGGPSGYNASCASTPCNLGIDFATLTNGAASGATTLLPGGTYDVVAYYPGDGSHAASESSPPVQVTVAAENSDTLITLETYNLSTGVVTSNVTSLAYGTPDLLRVDVTNSSGNLCYSSSTGAPTYQCPTGQVTVTLNGSPMTSPTVDVGAPSDNTPGTYTLNSQGTAEDQYIQLPMGTSTLIATYVPHPIAPNNSYNASKSSSYTVTVTQAGPPTVTVSSNPSPPVQSGASVTLTATVATAGFGLAPTGTVTFYNGNNLIGGVPTYTSANGSPIALTVASLTASLTTTFTANASITAKYSGDANYAASTSPAFALTVSAQADFSLTASPTSLSVTPGQTGLTVISAGPLNGFTGTVNLTCAIPSAMSYTTCTLTPTSFTISGTGSGSSNLDVATTAPSTALRRFNGPRWFIPSAGALLAAIFLLLIPGRKRRVKLAFGALVLALLAAGFVACGGGSSTVTTGNSGTPPGTYTVTVTGTSSNLTHTVNIPVTVQ